MNKPNMKPQYTKPTTVFVLAPRPPPVLPGPDTVSQPEIKIECSAKPANVPTPEHKRNSKPPTAGDEAAAQLAAAVGQLYDVVKALEHGTKRGAMTRLQIFERGITLFLFASVVGYVSSTPLLSLVADNRAVDHIRSQGRQDVERLHAGP